MSPVFLASLFWIGGLGGIVAGGTLLLLVGIAITPGRAFRNRLRAALVRRECPDCAYPLGQIPPGLASDMLSGLDAGPTACPECGAPWPLLPPPTVQR
jgi:hypothetical protein